MRRSRILATAAVATLAAVVITAAAVAGNGAIQDSSQQARGPHAGHLHLVAGGGARASNLRVALNRLLGEHALLAIEATQAGYSGHKDFPAVSKALDRNSVELSKAIGGIFGKPAGNKFLNGQLLWRDHIRFFVNYTIGLAKKDRSMQNKAVASLNGYVEAFSAFLASATGLPKSALRASIRSHVMQLKGQLDAYAKSQYAKSYTLTRQAYHHMGMTGDVLAAAIVKKFPRRFS